MGVDDKIRRRKRYDDAVAANLCPNCLRRPLATPFRNCRQCLDKKNAQKKRVVRGPHTPKVLDAPEPVCTRCGIHGHEVGDPDRCLHIDRYIWRSREDVYPDRSGVSNLGAEMRAVKKAKLGQNTPVR